MKKINKKDETDITMKNSFSIKTSFFKPACIMGEDGKLVRIKKKDVFKVGRPILIYRRVYISKGNILYINRKFNIMESGMYKVEFENPSIFTLRKWLNIVWAILSVLALAFESLILIFGSLWFITSFLLIFIMIYLKFNNDKLLDKFDIVLEKV